MRNTKKKLIIETDGVTKIIENVPDEETLVKISDYLKSFRSLEDKK